MRVVVIGNGMVGYKFCEKLISKKVQGLSITVFGEEMRPAYDRVHLSEYFSGKSADDLLLAPSQWYHENGITLHLGSPVYVAEFWNRHRQFVLASAAVQTQ